MARQVDQAELAAARALFRSYLAAVAAERRAETMQVRGEMRRHVELVVGEIAAIETAAAYFDGRRMAGLLPGAGGNLAARLGGTLTSGSPHWIAGFADGLRERIGDTP